MSFRLSQGATWWSDRGNATGQEAAKDPGLQDEDKDGVKQEAWGLFR